MNATFHNFHNSYFGCLFFIVPACHIRVKDFFFFFFLLDRTGFPLNQVDTPKISLTSEFGFKYFLVGCCVIDILLSLTFDAI